MLPGIAIICFGLATLAGALRRLYKGDEKFVLFKGDSRRSFAVERGDPPRGVAFGRFVPTELYDQI